MEPFTRNKVFTCKEDLDDAIDSFIGNDLIQVRGDEENTVFQITKELRVLKLYYHNKIAMTPYVVMKTFKMVQMMVQ